METGAVIAAAGLSAKLTSARPMLQLCGSTIIHTVVSSLKESGIKNIVVVTGNDAEIISKHLSAMDVTCLFNADYNTTDMFYSACMGLDFIKDKCDRTFFLPADMPLLSSDNLFTMLGYMDCHDCEILLPTYGGNFGHPLLLKSSIIPAVMSYRGGRGMRGAILNHKSKMQTIEIDDMGVTLDTDKPENLEQLKTYIKAETKKVRLGCSVRVGIKRRKVFFSGELCTLLHEIDSCHSLSKACETIGIAYSRGWKSIKIAENQLEFPLLDCRVGGNSGGGSVLTEKCRLFMHNYENYNKKVEKFAEDTFAECFSEYLD